MWYSCVPLFILLSSCTSGEQTPTDGADIVGGAVSDPIADTGEASPPEDSEPTTDADTAGTAKPDSDTPAEPLEEEDPFERLITVTEGASGDLSCFRPGTSCASLRADESCLGEDALAGVLVDFRTGEPIPGATVELQWSDDITSDADATAVTDDQGRFSGAALPVCTAVSYRVTTDPALGEAVTSYGVHQAWSDLDGGLHDATLLAQSSDTSQALTEALELELDPAHGMITGRIMDCTRGSLRSVQVIASGIEGYITSQAAHYFAEGALAPDLTATASEGRWLITGCLRG